MAGTDGFDRGSGTVERTDESMDEWRDEVRDAVSVVDECPI